MTYTTTLNDTDYFSEGLLVRLSPRRKILHGAFSVFSGSVYSCSFDYGKVSSIEIDGVALTEGSSTSLSADQWYWDENVLYVRKVDSTAPDSDDFIVATYHIYIGDFDYQWHSTPDDDTTSLSEWGPYLRKFPQIKQTTSDLLSGFIPTSVDSIEVINADHWFERHMTSSFNSIEVKGWHWVSSLAVANLSLILDALVESISYDQTNISLTLTDIYQSFEKEFRTGGGFSDFYNATDFPSIDTNFIGKPKRRVYGYCRGLKCVNLDYSTSNAESDNQNWGVFNSQAALLGAGSYGSIRFDDYVDYTSGNDIYFLDADYVNNFEVNDQIKYVDGFADQGERYVTAIGAGFITMNATMASWGGTADDAVYRGQVPRIRIEQEEVIYTARWKKHFNILNSNGVAYAEFIAGYSASLGMSPVKYSDDVFADVYGVQVTAPINSANESKDSIYTVTVNPIDILFDMMTTIMGGSVSDFSANWETLADSITQKIGFAIPQNVNDDYPTLKDVLSGILSSCRLRIFKNNENKWDIKQIGAIGATVDTATDDDILDGTFSAEFNYAEILSDVFVEYNYRERGLLVNKTEAEYDSVTSSSETAEFLHKVVRQKTFQSYHMLEADAQEHCDALGHYYADRLGTYKMRLSKRFLDSLIADEVTISREKIPATVYVEGTLQTKNLVISEISKSPNSINVVFDDQQGLEDNA